MSVLNPYFYALNPEILAFENTWVNYIKENKRNNTVIDKVVWESWERCRANDLDPLSTIPLEVIPEEDLLNRIAKNHTILKIVSSFLHTIFDVVKGPGFMVMFCDSDGIVLKQLMDDEIAERIKNIKLLPGANLSEDKSGTNGVDLTLQTGKPIRVTGAEHYRQLFHSLTVSSAPLFDYSGNLIGVLSIVGRHELVHQHTLGMVTSSAKAIENEIHIQKINEQLIENNSQQKAILQSVSDGVLYVRDKKVTQINDEMLSLLGRKRSDIGLENVEKEIITNPEIGKILDENYILPKNGKITLYGKLCSYNCIVTRHGVYGSNRNEIGKVLIFKQVEDINQLAKNINKYSAHYTFDSLIGKSEALKEAVNIAVKASEHDSRVIIVGESGTGKEMFAQAIHNASNRKNHPFVALDCGAIPKELLESTLFGYERGAFTGAKESGNTGAFELANMGTLFLDEIGNMPYDMQIKLLRVLQEGTVVKVGGSVPIEVDVRVITATNVPLEEMVEKGTFREDLFYRLNVVYIKMPPLRERKSDIPLLVRNFLETKEVKNKKLTIEAQALEMLQRYDWPGNIRQLYNAIERAGIMTTGRTIKVEDLPLEIIKSADDIVDLSKHEKELIYPEDMALDKAMKKYVLYCLSKNNHNITKTAKALGITRVTIYKIINKSEGKDRCRNDL